MVQTQITELLDLSDMSEEQLTELATNATNILANIRMKKTQLVRDRIAVINADIHTLAAEFAELKATEQIVLHKIQSQTNRCHELESTITFDINCGSCRVHKFVNYTYFCMYSLELCTRLRCADCLVYSDNDPC